MGDVSGISIQDKWVNKPSFDLITAAKSSHFSKLFSFFSPNDLQI